MVYFTTSLDLRESISSAENPSRERTSSVCWPGCGGGDDIAPGVLLNRGAGAGCITPAIFTNVSRS